MRRGRSGAAKPYGSVYKWNSARNAFELRERKEPDHRGSHLTLKHRKSNLGVRMSDLNLTLQWDAAGAQFMPEQVAATVVMPVVDQIVDVLETGPANPRQIADLLSDDDVVYNEIDVRRELKTLLGLGKVTALGDGSIRLVQPQKDVVESPLLPDQ